MSDRAEPGEPVKIVARRVDTDTNAVLKHEIRGTVSHTNGDGEDYSIWFEAELSRWWWEDEPRKLARENENASGVYGVTPRGESDRYQVRIDSNDGFCNPVGQLVELEVGGLIA